MCGLNTTFSAQLLLIRYPYFLFLSPSILHLLIFHLNVLIFYLLMFHLFRFSSSFLPLIFTILSFLQQHIRFLSVGRTVCLTLIHFFSYSFIHSFLTVLDNLLILLSKVYLINFLFINSSIYNIFKVNCFDL